MRNKFPLIHNTTRPQCRLDINTSLLSTMGCQGTIITSSIRSCKWALAMIPHTTILTITTIETCTPRHLVLHLITEWPGHLLLTTLRPTIITTVNSLIPITECDLSTDMDMRVSRILTTLKFGSLLNYLIIWTLLLLYPMSLAVNVCIANYDANKLEGNKFLCVAICDICIPINLAPNCKCQFPLPWSKKFAIYTKCKLCSVK